MKRICVIGNFSGRNAGDAAILEGLLHDVHAVNSRVQFIVPTINTGFVRQAYSRYPIKPVSLLPWHLSVKIFGLPIFFSVLSSDIVLVTDAILFDRRLWDPLYNYLSTMALVLPAAKRRGIPVFLYNVSLGPITCELGRACTKRVLESSEMVIVRDTESIDMLKTWRLWHPRIVLGADCALNVPLVDPSRLERIKAKEGIFRDSRRYMSFNVSSYLDVFVKGRRQGIDKDSFTAIIAETMERILTEMGLDIIFVITQPMDLPIAERVLAKMQCPDRVTLLSNKTYSHNELAAILSRVEMHVGMRTHSLILATASCTPTVGIIATPKNRGYMKSIEQAERMIEFGKGFTAANLFDLIRKTWEERSQVRTRLQPIIAREKEKARRSAEYLLPYLSGE
ncbi:MAG: polysaccharide pyruvyl transferase family protein [Desulfosoma sp.]